MATNIDAQTERIIKPLEQPYSKAPALPTGAKEFIVSVAPWLSLIFGILLVLTGIGGLGIFTAFSPLTTMYGGVGNSTLLLLSSVLVLVQGAIMVWAFSPLKARRIRGWNLWVWTEVIAVVSSAISLSVGSIVWAIIGAAIAFYFLFQVRSYYK